MSDITHYSGAFCIPGERINRRQTTFGVYDQNGALAENTEIHTSSWTALPNPTSRKPNFDLQVFGPSLFAGSTDKQFGFVLLNGLGRLWALDGLPENTTIVFGEKFQNNLLYNFVPLILRSLGILNPIVVLRVSTWFEELHCPEEIFGEVHHGRGSSEFYDWIDERWACSKVKNQGRKIYVTRSALGPMAGRFACEDHLERQLEAECYEIYAPEKHSLQHQIETFLSAEKLIFAEGSALHLFSLIRQPHQVSAVIQRRPDFPQVMRNQMADRKGEPTIAIDAISDISWPPVRGEHFSRSELDFERLRKALKDLGLIKGEAWQSPSVEAVTASLRAGLSASDPLMSRKEHKAWKKERRRGVE